MLRLLTAIGTLVGIIVGGIAIYEFVIQDSNGNGPDSIEEPSFLERVAGHYTLSSWTEANRPISIGAQITDGSLDIDELGTADWSVDVEQTYSADPGRVEMTARGKIQLGPERILGVKGGEFNNTTYLDDKWGQVGTEVELAVRGWASGSGDDPFTISLDTQTDGPHILQMRNSRGTYTWVKQ